MTQIKVLICDPIHEKGINQMLQEGFTVDVKTDITRDELQSTITDYDALIVRSRTKITRTLLNSTSRLKAVGRVGVGLDNIDLTTAKENSVAVFNSPEASAQAVAELTIGLIISLARRLPFADKTMKEGTWAKKQLSGWLLEGKTLGLLGLGNIGLRVAKIAKALGMKNLITKRAPPAPELLAELDGEYVPFDDLLERSDVLSIHIPLNSSTHHMIGQRELQIMKDGAYIINTARGPLIDERALLKALLSGKLAGAALDVYEMEPPKNLAIVKLSNVVCTPHIGGQTHESQIKASNIIANKIIGHLKRR